MINQFFKQNDFPEESIRFSPVLQNNVSIDDYIVSNIPSKYIKDPLETELPPVESHFLEDILKKIKFRKLGEEARLGKKLCIPFSNRTYVRSDGSIQFCERIENYGKINDNLEELPVKSEGIYSEFKSFKQDSCSKCFAYNFCEMCPASFVKNSKFDSELASLKCNQYRKTVKQALHIYINQMEVGTDSEC